MSLKKKDKKWIRKIAKYTFITVSIVVILLILSGQSDNPPSTTLNTWTTIYETNYQNSQVEPFEFNPTKIKEGKLYPDHPCVKARISDGILITTTIDRQECFIPGYNTNLLTFWSDVATVTYNEDYIFPHPKLKMTAKFMFPKATQEEYYFHMNPEIFTDSTRGNYNLFAQIRVSNKGKIIYIGENDKEITLPNTIKIIPDKWYNITLIVDMQTREYSSLKITDDTGSNFLLVRSPSFKSKFTRRENNGVDNFRPYMGFWIGTNIPFNDRTTQGQDVYIDYFKVEVMQ